MQPLRPTLTGDDTLNQIVARYPETMEVFRRFGLDTCCGGALPLAVAAEHHGLPLATLLAALEAQLERAAQ